MHCTEVQGSWEEYQKKKLPADQRRAVEKHLAQCTTCRSFYSDYQHIYSTYDQLRPVQPPPSLWTDIDRALDEREQQHAPFWDMLRTTPRYALAVSSAVVVLIVSISAVGLERSREAHQVSDYLHTIDSYMHSDTSWVDETTL